MSFEEWGSSEIIVSKYSRWFLDMVLGQWTWGPAGAVCPAALRCRPITALTQAEGHR